MTIDRDHQWLARGPATLLTLVLMLVVAPLGDMRVVPAFRVAVAVADAAPAPKQSPGLSGSIVFTQMETYTKTSDTHDNKGGDHKHSAYHNISITRTWTPVDGPNILNSTSMQAITGTLTVQESDVSGTSTSNSLLISCANGPFVVKTETQTFKRAITAAFTSTVNITAIAPATGQYSVQVSTRLGPEAVATQKDTTTDSIGGNWCTPSPTDNSTTTQTPDYATLGPWPIQGAVDPKHPHVLKGQFSRTTTDYQGGTVKTSLEWNLVLAGQQCDPPNKPSGANWVSPGDTRLHDLNQPFRGDVERFLAAVNKAHGQPKIAETYRSPQRSYLMHYAWEIAKLGMDPKSVPPYPGVDICWVHRDAAGNPDIAASRAAAQAMVSGFGLVHIAVLVSKHNFRLAIDMQITWTGTLKIEDAARQTVEITSTPRDSYSNSDLWAVGATYGVHKLTTDKPHWSNDGS